ncbi:MAG: hypothetical protein AB7S39_16480 [Gemmatimonadales bacterium]
MRALPNPIRALAVAALIAGPLAGCDDILKVNNPEQIPIAALADTALITAQVRGVISEFEDAYTRNNGAWLWTANFITDEQVTGLNWEDYARVNQRIVNYTEGPVASLWGGLSSVVRLGEDVTTKIEDLLTANDPRIAVAQLWTGYGYTLIGEGMCMAVFGTAENLGSEIETPEQVFNRAVGAFNKAITVASATNQPNIANAARVGLARVYLSLKDFPKVIQNAQAVPAGFKYMVEYSSAQSAENNGLYGNVHGANHNMGVSQFFLQGTFGTQGLVATQTDPRIQHTINWTKGHNALTPLYKPYQGLRFSGYTGNTIAPASANCPNCTGSTPSSSGDTGPLLIYQQNTQVALADYLEAQHHMMEAMARQGGNDAAVLAFVNARRAVGNQAPVTLSGSALFAELRTQRSRDFYQGGFRLGDLRRWKRDGVGDFFPTGAHVNQEWGNYSNWTCFPLPLQEYEGNPNISKPADPFTPPGI